MWTLLAQAGATIPGFIGSFWRAAFYRLTLERSSIDVVIAFGTFFSRQQVTLERNVSIGSYCVIGRAKIGARTQISSHVEIPGGRMQHLRDEQGRLSESRDNAGDQAVIGEDCWIGAAAVVLANVGARSTIGAGSVVTKDIPPDVVAAGVPAKVIKSSAFSADGENGGKSTGD
jgi:acetyltransferase-like isoleucine patch superfamily enzyme